MFLTILQLLKYSTLLLYFTWEKGHKFYVHSCNFLEYPYLAKKKNPCHYIFILKLPYQPVCPFSEEGGLKLFFSKLEVFIYLHNKLHWCLGK